MRNLNNGKFAKIFGILSVSILFMFSCSDSFLDDIKPLDKISDANVWTDIKLVEGFVNDIYSDFRSGWLTNMYISAMGDDAYARERSGAFLVQQGGINPSNLGYASTIWPTNYNKITKCNAVLDRLQGEVLDNLKSQDEERVNLLIGEVKLIRAWAYHRLAASFGGVPLITRKLSMDDEIDIPRNSYGEIVEFIVSECNEAANLLPLEWDASNLGRPTKGAALALKSRMLLYTASPLHNPGNEISKWQDAADATKAVIDLNLYSLNPDYLGTFTEEGNFNDEIIMEIVYNNDVWRRFTVERNMFPGAESGRAVCVPVQSHVDAYETINGLRIQDDPTYDPQNPYVNRDPRFHDVILHDGAPWRDRNLVPRLIEVFEPGGRDTRAMSGTNATQTGYYANKFADVNWTRPIQESSSPNWILFRYAEILLNYAEAQYHLGNEDVAREYVNMVRSRPSVMMPAVTASGEDLLDRIKNERRIELYLEEHRFFDIRRWKETYPEDFWLQRVDIWKDLDTGERTFSFYNLLDFKLPEHTCLLPIPQIEIDRSPALVQNPGY